MPIEEIVHVVSAKARKREGGESDSEHWKYRSNKHAAVQCKLIVH